MRNVRGIFAAIGLLCLMRGALGVDLAAGPMIGDVSDQSARVWMQFPHDGSVKIRVYNVEAGGAPPVNDIEQPTQYGAICSVPLGDLQPGHSYRLEVALDGEMVRMPEVVIRTCPTPGTNVNFSVAFGSGMALSPMPHALPPGKDPAGNSVAATAQAPLVLPLDLGPPDPPKRSMPIFKAITKTNPRAFMFLGNTGYLPETLAEFPPVYRQTPRFFSDFQSAIRREPDLQELFRTTPTYGIYGDRDFGPVNADSRFPYTRESQVVFSEYWPNPDWGTPGNLGCYCTYSYGDVDFFLLDARKFRDPESKPPVMLGDAQLSWLEKHLAASRASFKVIAAPCALFGDDPAHLPADGWARFPEEQREFLDFLSARAIGGVISIAGNQPVGQLTKVTAVPGGGVGRRYRIRYLRWEPRRLPGHRSGLRRA